MKLLEDTSKFLKERIDYVFGEGTSRPSGTTIDMFEQFLDGITPYIQKSRDNKN